MNQQKAMKWKDGYPAHIYRRQEWMEAAMAAAAAKNTRNLNREAKLS